MPLRHLPGHFRTVSARLAAALAPPPAPPARPWSAVVDDPRIGPVRLTGLLSEPPHSSPASPASLSLPSSSSSFSSSSSSSPRPAVVVVHGLGGCADSAYARRAAMAVAAAGWGCLRLNLRGADRRGEDYYHAGLTADLHAALASPELADFSPLYLLGFSLGGHVALRAATEPACPRLAAVAAVCAPLALAPCAEVIDRPSAAIYRGYLLRSLRRIYEAVAARRAVPVPPAAVRRIRSIREWDDKVVAPRHGFAGADDYYRRASVAGRLGDLHLPALLVLAEDDPMVPLAAVLPALEGAPPSLVVHRVARGGHLALPAGARLGLPGESARAAPAGWVGEILDWLAKARPASAAV